MSNSAAFFEAFVHVPHTVLGKRLEPLSLFHLVWLYHIESPLVLTSRDVTLEDLELGVVICSSKSSEEVFSKLKSKNLNFIQRLKRFLWNRANRTKRDFKTELQKFLEYNDDYIALPRFIPKEEEGQTDEKLPWLLLHAASLIKATGWDEETVFRMPVGKVLWFNLAIGYLQTGESRVMSDKEAEAVELLKGLYGGGALTGQGS